ncbi:MAG: ABC transporter permease [Acidobacteriota bacterium]|nr:ABC transporter permease [Acidobacteriota bacterium]
MWWFNVLAARLRALFGREAVIRDIDEELLAHVEMETEANVARGMSPEAARRAALRSFGNPGRVRDTAYEVRGGGMLETLWQDVRYGVRALLKQPGFAAVAVLTLALGIGANSTIFSFANGVLLRPLPYENPERLVLVDETAPKRGITSMGVSFPNFLDWRAQNQVFEDIAAYQAGTYTLVGGGEPEQIRGARVSSGLFEILGVSPVLGRTVHQEEDRPGNETVVVLGHGLWQGRFGADPGIVGRTISLNNRPHAVIGVMPPGFKFPEVADLWLPLALDTQRWTRTDHGLSAIARLKPGVTLEQAQAEMAAVASRIEEQNPVTNEGMSVSVTDLRAGLVGDYRQSLLILLGVVGFVLLIACVNVANLLLARASARQKEISIRAALGASRRRIFRQLITESLVLSVVGGALGLVLALWGLRLLLAAIPVEFPFWMKFNLDGRVVGFTAAVSLLTGAVFGAAPALQASKVDLNETLKEGGRSAAAGAGRGRLRSLLVVAEVALSLVLLVGAGLMMRSFLRLQQVNVGLDPKNVLTMTVSLPAAKYSEPERQSAFFRQLVERVGRLPGAQAAGAVSNLPLSGSRWGRSLTVEGRPVLAVGEAPVINHCVVTPGYFRALGIPLLTGRDLAETDARDAPKVTVVDARLAREYWPGESPLGKRVRFGPPESNEPWHTVVGVVGEVRHERVDAATRMTVYVPYQQITVRQMTVAVRTASDPAGFAAAAREQVRALDADQPVTNLRTMEEVISRAVWQPRLHAILFGVFAAVALLLASVGIYGVMSYAVTQRTHEIGVRVALGARPRDILRLIVGRGFVLTLIGVGLGAAAALALTRVMASLLFEVSAADPATFATNVLLLTAVSLLACYIPARRATRVDPIIALRYE